LEIFTLHHCAMNGGFGGYISSFITVCYGYVWGEAISSSVYVFRLSSGKYSVCSEFWLCSC